MFTDDITSCTEEPLWRDTGRWWCQEFLGQCRQVTKPVRLRLPPGSRIILTTVRGSDKYWSNSALMQLPSSVADSSVADTSWIIVSKQFQRLDPVCFSKDCSLLSDKVEDDCCDLELSAKGATTAEANRRCAHVALQPDSDKNRYLKRGSRKVAHAHVCRLFSSTSANLLFTAFNIPAFMDLTPTAPAPVWSTAASDFNIGITTEIAAWAELTSRVTSSNGCSRATAFSVIVHCCALRPDTHSTSAQYKLTLRLCSGYSITGRRLNSSRLPHPESASVG